MQRKIAARVKRSHAPDAVMITALRGADLTTTQAVAEEAQGSVWRHNALLGRNSYAAVAANSARG